MVASTPLLLTNSGASLTKPGQSVLCVKGHILIYSGVCPSYRGWSGYISSLLQQVLCTK